MSRFNPRDFTWEGVPPGAYRPPDAGVKTPAWQGVTRHTLVGRRGEPTAFHLRYFQIQPGGYSNLEKHRHAHAVVILRGCGRALVGEEIYQVAPYDFVFVPPLVPHQFINDGEEPFGFLCPVDAERDPPQPVAPGEATRAGRAFDKRKSPLYNRTGKRRRTTEGEP
ncbi:MAG: cupin domain-containing protein [Armatimonadetes bacterium]|nr:cupin domain-containing protein [Armatimonadota bacterium]